MCTILKCKGRATVYVVVSMFECNDTDVTFARRESEVKWQKPAVNHINDTRYTSLSGIHITLPNKPLTILFDTKFNNQVPFTH